MTRYLSEVSGYYGCQWRQGTMLDQQQQQQNKKMKYEQMTNILQQRDVNCRRMRLNSLFDKMPKNELDHPEAYSPSVVRKLRAKTVPPLQNIYEDTIFYPSNWASPSLTKKQRRDIVNRQASKKQAALDRNNNNQQNVKNTTSALRVTEKFETKFHSPQLKRKSFGKHVLIPLAEDKMARSFDETSSIAEEDEDSCDENDTIGERRFRARSWSE